MLCRNWHPCGKSSRGDGLVCWGRRPATGALPFPPLLSGCSALHFPRSAPHQPWLHPGRPTSTSRSPPQLPHSISREGSASLCYRHPKPRRSVCVLLAPPASPHCLVDNNNGVKKQAQKPTHMLGEGTGRRWCPGELLQYFGGDG